MRVLSFFINFFCRISSYFCIGLLVTTNLSYGVFFKLDQWQRGDRNIYCLSDDHVQASYSQKQLNGLATFAKERDARIIVEDMIDYNGEDTRIANYLTQWHTTAYGKDVLVGVTDYLCEHGIARDKIDNVEFRQAAVVTIYGDVDLSVNDVMQPAYDEYHKGWSYRDGDIFDHYYQSKLQAYRQSVLKPCRSLFFYMYWRKSRPLVKVLSTARYYKSLDSVIALFHDDVNLITPEEKLKYIIVMHGTPLIDVKLVRAIAQAGEQDIIVCAGDGHINEVNKVLCDAGYQCVQSQTGTVRVNSRHSGTSRALNLHRILQQADPSVKVQGGDAKKVKDDTNQLEQPGSSPVSKTKQEKLDLFFMVLFVVLVLLAILRYQNT